MKIALITDTHFGARNDNLTFNDHFYKFYDEVFFPYLKENGIDTVIHLGDVLDRRKFVSYRIATDFRQKFLDRFQEHGIDLHLIVGNHDTYYKNTNKVNSLDELVHHKNATVYSEAETVEFDGTPILMMPWINSENYANAVEHLNTSTAQICMGHLEINGFEMHAGHLAENGYSKELFRRFDMVMSGHFHKKSDDGQIYYLGTPYQITWSDYNCPKGFHIFDTSTRVLTRVENPYTLFDKIYYDDSTYNYADVDVSRYNEKFIKVVVVNKKDFYQFDRFIDRMLSDSGAHEVKIIEDFSELDAENVDDAIVENAEDTVTLLDRYVDELDVTLDKDRLKRLMKSLYVEASDLEL